MAFPSELGREELSPLVPGAYPATIPVTPPAIRAVVVITADEKRPAKVSMMEAVVETTVVEATVVEATMERVETAVAAKSRQNHGTGTGLHFWSDGNGRTCRRNQRTQPDG
jgi:hypothetical protein